MGFVAHDATRDDRVHPSLVLGDGVAIQFATANNAPLFAIAIWDGSKDRGPGSKSITT
ncbi:MAG: hypothetical protein ACJA0V_002207 [Planctomycetota bacterium]